MTFFTPEDTKNICEVFTTGSANRLNQIYPVGSSSAFKIINRHLIATTGNLNVPHYDPIAALEPVVL